MIKIVKWSVYDTSTSTLLLKVENKWEILKSFLDELYISKNNRLFIYWKWRSIVFYDKDWYFKNDWNKEDNLILISIKDLKRFIDFRSWYYSDNDIKKLEKYLNLNLTSKENFTIHSKKYLLKSSRLLWSSNYFNVINFDNNIKEIYITKNSKFFMYKYTNNIRYSHINKKDKKINEEIKYLWIDEIKNFLEKEFQNINEKDYKLIFDEIKDYVSIW